MICQSEFYYTVQPNDTLYTIAQRFQTTVSDLIRANPNINPDYLSIGQVIRICRGISIGEDALNVIDVIRSLWEQHGEWTRMAIASIIFSTPDKDFTIQRLLRNPEDFAEVLKPYYGEDIANEFSKLLKDHLVIAADLVNAAKAGNTTLVNEIEARWYQNAVDIATFLNRINLYYDFEEWRTMLFDHLAFVKKEAVELLNQDYQASIDTYDEMERQILLMADMMAEGIINQFNLK